MANQSGLDKFCGSEFWDFNTTWNTENPDFKYCFERTVLVWIPCVFLFTFAPLEAFYLLNSKNRNVPWNFLNLSKFGIQFILIVLCLADFGYVLSSEDKYHSVHYYTPFVLILSLIFSCILLYYNKVRGMVTSGHLFFFWLLLTICGAVQFRTEVLKAQSEDSYSSNYFFISYIIYFVLVFVNFILHCFADEAPVFSEYPQQKNPCPEQSSSALSRLVFAWFDRLAWLGFRKPLETSDLWSMNAEDTANEIVPKFEKYWERSVRSSYEKPTHDTMASFRKRSANIDFTGVTSKKKKPASILPVLCKAYGPTFLFGAILKLVNDCLTFVNPHILELLIDYVRYGGSEWKGYLYTVMMLVVATAQTIVLSQYFYRMMLVGFRIRTALISAIYRKALRLSNTSRKESTVGEIVNLMSVDAQRFMDLTTYLNMIWSAPLQIALALYFLWALLGPSVLAGLAVMIILIPINGFIANKTKMLQIKQMKYKDERVKLMNEILGGIKVLKLYAWEPSFEEQVLKIRNKEIKVLKEAAYLNAGTGFIWSCAPFLVSLITLGTYILIDPSNQVTATVAFVSLNYFNIMRFPMSMLPMLITFMMQVSLSSFSCFVFLGNEMSAPIIFVSVAYFMILRHPMMQIPMITAWLIQVSLVTFATFVLASEENVLTAKTAFVALSLFNILRFPLSMLPMIITSMVQASVSVKRINKFMNADELDPSSVSHDDKEGNPITVENASFAWNPSDEPILKNIDLSIKTGHLVAIVGTVGSGKSSLISALLGEMEKIAGKVNVNGSVAYVPQQAWIQNASLRENILFGKSLEHSIYTRVVDACALKPDLEMLPGGDQTEIGEKGINLSGGQKQRVSLARAVYHNSDIYFLDDPLSAVDAHVGKHIFDNVIGPAGILRTKTRLLVTHSITYLPDVDRIIVLKNGEVSEAGTYRELLDKKGAFAEFLVAHLQENEAGVELEEIKTQLESTIGSETLKQIQRQISETRSEGGGSIKERRVSASSSTAGDVDGAGGSRKDSTTASPIANGPTANGVAKPADKNKLIEIERAETGRVKWTVYSHYLRSIGIWLSVATILMNMAFQGFSIGANVWLSAWSNATSEAESNNSTLDKSSRDMYLGVYGAWGIGQGVTILFVDLLPSLGALIAAKRLHNFLVYGTLQAPLSFFDKTPLGRIVARFSNDVDSLDNHLPYLLDNLVYSLPSGLLLLFPEYGCLIAALKFHKQLLTHILRCPLMFFDTTPVGRIIGRFGKDFDILDNQLPYEIPSYAYYIVEVVATVVVISYSTPIFLAVIIPIGVLYYFVQRFYVATSRQLKRIESVSRSPIYSHFGESITGASVIRAYNVQHRFVKESEEKVDFNQICLFPSMVANRWLAVRLEMVGNLIIFFAALFAVLSRNTLSPGLVGLSVTYALQITQTLNWLVRMTSDVETNIVAVERIKEYGETPSEAAWDLPEHQPPPDWPAQGEVEFKDYRVRYREGLDLVLRGISFKVKGGEKVGIVGRTGAGKSSLTLGLFRIIEPAGGTIYIDGIDITKLGLHDLRGRLTIIPQDPVLFSGTIRLNLDPFERYSDQEVWTALEHAHLKDFISQLSLGLDHEVSEGGENLSVGQRQLICLARALLRKTKVLVLDEATAAVDLETDDLIQQTIRNEFKECTVLTIAHRLNTILDSDRIIVLDKGVIVEYDTPQALLSKPKSIFAGMARDAGISSNVDRKK